LNACGMTLRRGGRQSAYAGDHSLDEQLGVSVGR